MEMQCTNYTQLNIYAVLLKCPCWNGMSSVISGWWNRPDIHLHCGVLWELFQHQWTESALLPFPFPSPLPQLHQRGGIPMALTVKLWLVSYAVYTDTDHSHKHSVWTQGFWSDGSHNVEPKTLKCHLPTHQPHAYKHSCIQIMKPRTIYLFFPTHYCYMILMETKQGGLNMTPGGAAVFLNTTQGLTHSAFTLNASYC